MCKVSPDYQKSVTKVLDYNSASVNSENRRFIVSLILSLSDFYINFFTEANLPAFQKVYLSLNTSSFVVKNIFKKIACI